MSRDHEAHTRAGVEVLGQRLISLDVTRAAWICAHLDGLWLALSRPGAEVIAPIHRKRVGKIVSDLRDRIADATVQHITDIDLDALREGLVEGDYEEAA